MEAYKCVPVIVARAIYTTSDNGAVFLYNSCKRNEQFAKAVLREYIYLKYSIAILIINENTKRIPRMRVLNGNRIKSIKAVLVEAFRQDPLNCECNLFDMESSYPICSDGRKINIDKHEYIAKDFFRNLKAINAGYGYSCFSYETIQWIYNQAFKYINKSMTISTQGASGGGCLSAIACLSLVVLALVMAI